MMSRSNSARMLWRFESALTIKKRAYLRCRSIVSSESSLRDNDGPGATLTVMLKSASGIVCIGDVWGLRDRLVSQYKINAIFGA
jgi:hypothetical protein